MRSSCCTHSRATPTSRGRRLPASSPRAGGKRPSDRASPWTPSATSLSFPTFSVAVREARARPRQRLTGSRGARVSPSSQRATRFRPRRGWRITSGSPRGTRSSALPWVGTARSSGELASRCAASAWLLSPRRHARTRNVRLGRTRKSAPLNWTPTGEAETTTTRKRVPTRD